MVAVREYQRADGRSPFAQWFNGLNAQAAAKVAKVTIAITRIGQGQTANLKGVGGGVVEYKIDFGPGYRVYFGKDGDSLVILLGGGTKTRSGISKRPRPIGRTTNAENRRAPWH